MAPAAKKAILLVEDQAIIAAAERAALEKYGYGVTIAANGEAAIEAALALASLDLILMDINLGSGIDGTEAAAAILTRRDVPIVFLSSHSEPETVEKTERITSYGYVLKGSSMTVLDASIKMAFKLFDANQRLRKSEIRQHSIVSQIADMVMIIDPEGAATFVSPNSERCFGWKPEDFSGKDSWLAVHEDDLPRIRAELRGLLAEPGSSKSLEYRLRCKDGSYKAVEATARNLVDDPSIRGVLLNCHDITERKKAEAEGARQFNLLQAIIDGASEAIYCKGTNGRYEMINAAGARMIGYSVEEVIGNSDADLLPTDIARDFRLGDDLVLAGGEAREHEKTLELNGRTLAYRVRESPLLDGEGAIIGVIGVATDISALKESEVTLQRQLSLLDTIIESLAEPVFAKDQSGTYVAINQSASRLLGKPRNLVIGRTIGEVLPPETSGPIREADLAVMATGEPRLVEGSLRQGDETRFYSITKSPWMDPSGNCVGVVDISHDITEQRQAIASVKRSQEKLRNVLESARMGTWEWNIGTGEDLIDEGSAALLGYSLGELSGNTYDSWMGLKHPDDRKKADELVRRHLRGETDIYSCDTRARHKDGRWVWIQARGRVIERDEAGNPKRMFGIHMDATERKQAEESARYEQQLMQSLLDNAPDAIYFKDREGRFIKINTAFAKALGLEGPQDIIGKTDFDIYEAGAAQRQFESEQEIIRTGDPVVREEMASWGNNEDRWALSTKMPLKDKDGETVGVFGISTEITERKRSEDRIRALLAEKENLLKEVHHRIKNNMGTMESLLSLQASALTVPAAVDALMDAQARIRSMGLLYDRLYRSEDFKAVSAMDYLPALVDDIISVFPNGPGIETDIDVDDFILDAKTMSTVGIIVNEVVTNSMKYAFASRGRGRVRLAATMSGKRIRLSIGDDGVGMPSYLSLENSKGFGFLLIGTLARQLGGIVRIERKKGTTFLLEFDAAREP